MATKKTAKDDQAPPPAWYVVLVPGPLHLAAVHTAAARPSDAPPRSVGWVVTGQVLEPGDAATGKVLAKAADTGQLADISATVADRVSNGASGATAVARAARVALQAHFRAVADADDEPGLS